MFLTWDLTVTSHVGNKLTFGVELNLNLSVENLEADMCQNRLSLMSSNGEEKCLFCFPNGRKDAFTVITII